jgi:hypothetical protein
LYGCALKKLTFSSSLAEESFQPKGCGPCGMVAHEGKGFGLAGDVGAGSGKGVGFSFLQEKTRASATNAIEVKAFNKKMFVYFFKVRMVSAGF